jgi:oxygen-independent coproporphyrinogen-3 oxidase
MGLRLAEGIDLARIAERSGIAQEALLDGKAVASLSRQGLLSIEGSRLIVTDAGMPLLDRVLAEIVAV